MSGIAGIVPFDGSPDADALIHSMMGALAHLGRDGHSIGSAGPVVFGHLMMWTTPESLHETLPLFDPTTDLLLTADARIDNRSEAVAALAIQHRLDDITDSELVLAAYLRWGDECVSHLLGSFAFALWNGRQQTLLCATDRLNSRPLYYYHDGQRFIFASEIKAILSVSGVPKRLDELRLALSALNIVDLQEKELTYWQKLSQATAASVIKVTAQGITQRRYWQADPSVRLSYKSDSEWLEAFNCEMNAAIAACTRSAFPVAVMLSGGLDSSAIVGIAARQMAEEGRSLITVSAVNGDPASTSFPDERNYIDLFQDVPNLEMVYVPATGRGPLDDLEKIVQMRMTPVVDSRHFLMSALAEAAGERNARTLLMGMAGEFGPTAPGTNYMAELFVRGSWWTLARESWLQSRTKTFSLSSIIKGQILRPLVPPALLNRLRPYQNPWHSFQPLRKDFVESILGVDCWKGEQNGSLLPTLPDHRRTQAAMLEPVENLDYMESFMGYEQLRLWYPYLNKRLLEFCIAAPGSLKARNGYKRYLVRAALDGILPPAIQWRTSKEPFSTDYPLRFNRQRPYLQEFFASIPANDAVRELVDIPRLQKLAALEADNNRGKTLGSYVAIELFPRAVALIHFLRLL